VNAKRGTKKVVPTAPRTKFATLTAKFRASRMRDFIQRLNVTSETRILDVGGTPSNWLLTEVRPKVTLLNMPRGQEAGESTNFTWISGDGCQLPFRDQSFESYSAIP